MNRPQTVFMYSGQGSQYYQMGKELFEQLPLFREKMLWLNNVAIAINGNDILATVYDNNKRIIEPFSDLPFTSPAIFMIQYALTEVLIERGIIPDKVLGTSLGEMVALSVAGIIAADEMLKIVIEQSAAIVRFCRKGAMMAVLETPEKFPLYTTSTKEVELVAVNYPRNYVMAGPHDELEQIAERLLKEQVLFQYLPVSYAFHGSMMDVVKDPVLNAFNHVRFFKPVIPLLSCVTGQLINTVTKEHCWDIMRKPICFPEVLRLLEQDGKQYKCIDLGPSGTLSNFIKLGASSENISSYACMSPYVRPLEALEKISSLFFEKSAK
jgi:trans-AT polyketide synthase/acyltransferase/oxidoreductase domain-containing protein